jgi:hypothetical protein
MDVILVEDHLVLRWDKRKHQVREYLKILVGDAGINIGDEEVKKGLKKMFFGSADFIQRTHGTCC